MGVENMLECGKVTDAVYKRSVQKILSGWQLMEGCSVRMSRDGCTLGKKGKYGLDAASATVIGCGCRTAASAVHQAINQLAAAGGEPGGVMLQFMVPAGMEETELKLLTASAAAACSHLRIAVGQSDVTALPGLKEPAVTATVIGETSGIFKSEPAKADQDIIMTGYAGWRGSTQLSEQHRDRLEQHFNPDFLGKLLDIDAAGDEFSCIPAVKAAADAGVRAMYAAGDGGVFNAVWEMACREGLGARILLKAIPIRQETVEVCDYFNVSPYQLLSTGVLLMAADHGQKVLTELAAAGIPAVIIGHLTDDNDRVVLNEEEVRYLEPFRQDSISNIII